MDISDNIRSTLLLVLDSIVSTAGSEVLYSPDELICQWFDDAYTPDSQYWHTAFSHAEIEALKIFSDKYDLLLRKRTGSGFTDIAHSPFWQQIRNEDSDMLSLLSNR